MATDRCGARKDHVFDLPSLLRASWTALVPLITPAPQPMLSQAQRVGRFDRPTHRHWTPRSCLCGRSSNAMYFDRGGRRRPDRRMVHLAEVR